jgi:hypothetical protein
MGIHAGHAWTSACIATVADYFGYSGICGAVPNGSVMESAEAEAWLCEICQNETTLEASLVSYEYSGVPAD